MKALFIRFSSIGDIVLTFPVVRTLKDLHPDCSISFLTKEEYLPLLNANPAIDEKIAFKGSVRATRKLIKKGGFDIILDLHRNIRSYGVSLFAAGRTYRYPKLNIRKALFTGLKLDYLPEKHIVDRYLETLEALGAEKVTNGICFSVPEGSRVDLADMGHKNYSCIALGAKFHTKKIPMDLLESIAAEMEGPVLLLGDSSDAELGEELLRRLPQKQLVNCAGKYDILQSASILEGSSKLITGDTGLMHIASFFDIQIISIWGNTSPKFGMFPYRQNKGNTDVIFEKQGLKCRPCSKIGYDTCPKGHFRCMDHNPAEIVSKLL